MRESDLDPHPPLTPPPGKLAGAPLENKIFPQRGKISGSHIGVVINQNDPLFANFKYIYIYMYM